MGKKGSATRKAEDSVEDLQRQLAEAEARHQAVSEILRSITAHPGELEMTLDSIAQNTVRFCAAEGALIHLVEGQTLRVMAWSSWRATPTVAGTPQPGPGSSPRVILPLDRGTIVGAAVLDRRTTQVEDLDATNLYPMSRTFAKDLGFRAMLTSPILCGNEVVGALSLRRVAPGAFSEREVALADAFAIHAGIAIENVRLFNEAKESLERQTALSEILQVISASPTDLQPVFDTIARDATRYCAAEDAVVQLVEGARYRVVAHVGSIPQIDAAAEMPLEARTLSARVMREARTLQVPDLTVSEEYPEGATFARAMGVKCFLIAPLLRDGRAIGTISLRRRAAVPFTDRQIQLLEAFAAQAVIAIENVRLFNETKEALEQQTATADVLKVINRSVLDLPAVLHSVVAAAARLCEADFGCLNEAADESVTDLRISRSERERIRGQLGARYTGRWSRVGAFYGRTDELQRQAEVAFSRVKPIGELFPMYRQTATSLAILDRKIINVPDFTLEPDLQASGYPKAINARALLVVPLLRESEAIGAIALYRLTTQPFTEREVALVQTFADQAVIAIENMRLFNEIEEKSRQLQVASQHKSEFLANMSHELRTPLNAIIGFSDVLLAGMSGDLTEKQRDYVQDIQSSGQHQLNLINDILDLSKVEAGRMELEVGRFELGILVAQAAALVKERAASHNISLSVDVPDTLGPVAGDERKVKQVILNLLSNAVKFTPDGGWIGVVARTVGDQVEIAVRDTGIGIAEQDQEKVFEEFRQVGAASEGTGLGLALSKRFVELHGGRISVESEVGKGSTFTVHLPLRQAVQEPARP